MKIISTLFFLCCCIALFAQEDKLRIQGKVVNKNGDPVTDVYIINANSHEKDITQADGIFTIRVTPNDSIILSHISYYRKSVKVYTLLLNPVVVLESDNIKIPEITVTPENQNDYERAKNNLMFLKDYKVQSYTKIKPENDPVQTIMTEHNRMMRTEAGMLNLGGIPLQALTNVGKKKKTKRRRSNSYFSTRKQKDLTPED
jgi:hypothetical protein